MRHLNETELLDAAEGNEVEGATAHLAACARCREQVVELRALMSAAADVPVPEPSPLFWDHFSTRVGEQVRAVGESNSRRGAGWMFWRLAVPAAALAAVAFAAVITLRQPAVPAPSNTAASGASEIASADGAEPPVDDPSLSLLADLASDLDWDEAIEAGLPTGAGALDHALFDMSEDERLQLQELLKEELSSPSGRGV
jgi:hypothetical protein